MQPCPDPVFRAHIAEVIIVFAGHAQIFPYQYLVRPPAGEHHQLGRAEVLQERAGFASRLVDGRMLPRVLRLAIERKRLNEILAERQRNQAPSSSQPSR